MNNESKFYNEIKKNLSEISWIRLENSVLLGVADLLAYNVNGTFFTVELKVARGNKISFSPHQIAFHIRHPKNTFICVKGKGQRSPKLFEGAMVRELSTYGCRTKSIAEGYEEIKKFLGSL